MRTFLSSVLAALLLVLLAANLYAVEGDAENCTDTPQFSRLPGYLIKDCETNDYSYFEFPMADDDQTVQKIEGKYWMVDYQVKPDVKPNSYLSLIRNYQNAITKAGGKILYINDKDLYRVTGKIAKNGQEIWVNVRTRDDGAGYWIYLIQKDEMKQEVTSSIMMDSLNATGHIALAINFETGKAEIKQESQTILESMIDLMKTNHDLKVEIQGHTDNVGKSADNKKLSQDRADAVKKALIDGGVAAERMTAVGYGDTKPIADNKTEEGKAQNRRVELVKK